MPGQGWMLQCCNIKYWTLLTIDAETCCRRSGEEHGKERRKKVWRKSNHQWRCHFEGVDICFLSSTLPPSLSVRLPPLSAHCSILSLTISQRNQWDLSLFYEACRCWLVQNFTVIIRGPSTRSYVFFIPFVQRPCINPSVHPVLTRCGRAMMSISNFRWCVCLSSACFSRGIWFSNSSLF